jgi:D-ornithine 4,5-aminomutase subunit beta
MQRLHDLAVERGMREKVFLIAGGTQVTNESARACGLDAGFGRGTKGHQVATYIVKKLRALV